MIFYLCIIQFCCYVSNSSFKITVDLKLWEANVRGLSVFAYPWGFYFVNASVFSFCEKTISKFVFLEDVNSWGRATHEYNDN